MTWRVISARSYLLHLGHICDCLLLLAAHLVQAVAVLFLLRLDGVNLQILGLAAQIEVESKLKQN
jgi:hypothetical protein